MKKIDKLFWERLSQIYDKNDLVKQVIDRIKRLL